MMDLHRIATSISSTNVEAARRKKVSKPKQRKEEIDEVPTLNLLQPQTEYSCKMELSLIADFEGSITKKNLVKKVKAELVASIKAGMSAVCNDLGIECTNVLVNPLQIECVVNDESSFGDDESSFGDDE